MEKGFDSSSVRDLSLQEVLSAIFDEIAQLLRLIKKYWLLFVIGMIVFALIGWYSNKSPYYQTNYSFFMHSESVWMDSAVRNPKAFFVGDMHLPSANPLEKMSQILGSERILYNALLSSATINGVSDLLVNHYLKLKTSENHGSVKEFKSIPISDSSYDLMSKTSQETLQSVAGVIANSVQRIIDRESSIIHIIISSQNEEFAFAFANSLFNSFVNFCKEEAVSSTSKNLNMIQRRIDSIEKVNPIPDIISELYKYRELLKFQMMVNPPSVTVIKKPTYPISYVSQNKWKLPVYYAILYFATSLFVLRLISLLKSVVKNAH